MKKATAAILSVAVAGALATATMAQNLSPTEQLDARKKVETAVALAEIAEAEGDGEGLLVAARLLAGVGKVERRDSKGAEPSFYSVGDLTAAAKSLGVDAARADAISSPEAMEPNYCYWDFECLGSGTFECGWIYACTE